MVMPPAQCGRSREACCGLAWPSRVRVRVRVIMRVRVRVRVNKQFNNTKRVCK